MSAAVEDLTTWWQPIFIFEAGAIHHRDLCRTTMVRLNRPGIHYERWSILLRLTLPMGSTFPAIDSRRRQDDRAEE